SLIRIARSNEIFKVPTSKGARSDPRVVYLIISRFTEADGERLNRSLQNLHNTPVTVLLSTPPLRKVPISSGKLSFLRRTETASVKFSLSSCFSCLLR